MGKAMMEAVVDEQNEKISDASATNWRLSADNVSSEGLSSSASIGYAPCDHDEDNVGTDGSSPLGWPLGIRSHKLHAETVYVSVDPPSISSGVALWDMKRKKRQTEMSEVELMKERFAKLLLGEDMSGGGKGVSSALAISNAITNLSASVFGEIWRLEPLSAERKSMWRREMAWLLSVADHIVELVPSWQTFPDGSDLEVMVARPRSDLHINLPALRKLDAMLLESLDSFSAAGEFWYEEQGIVSDEQHHMLPLQRQLEKWWLPSPRVPANGLSSETTKHLRHQRDCVNQILKAALAINNQTLSEMEVPDVFWDALPKNGKASLGEALYKHIASQCFSPEAVLETLDVSTDHSAMEVGGRIEAAIHVWRRKRKQQQKNPRPPPPPPPPPHHHHRRKPGQGVLDYSKFDAKASWGVVRDFVRDMHKREVLAGRAERLLLCLKQKFPDLPQSILDKTKIQYNKDLGLSILESYSRVLESLAFNIAARVDEVLYIDEMTKRNNNKLSKQQ